MVFLAALVYGQKFITFHYGLELKATWILVDLISSKSRESIRVPDYQYHRQMPVGQPFCDNGMGQ